MKKIFCPHVLNALELTTTGEYRACCVTTKAFQDENNEKFNVATATIDEVIKSKDRQDWIQNFDDVFETDCRQCHEVETAGGESKRLREINYWQTYHNIEKTNIANVIHDQNKLEVLDLKLGNVCNLACATCHPASSTKWNSLYKQYLGEFSTLNQNWQDTDKFWDDLIKHVAHIKKIEIAGGEPFMNKKQKRLINYLVDNDLAKNIDITWITNSTFYEEDVVDKFKYFRNVSVMISIDNTHEQFEYMRFPAKWDESYNIFLKYKKLNDNGIINLGISHTISFLNVYRLPEFWSWAREHKVNVFNNLVMWPYCVQMLPDEFKQIVKERLESESDPSYQNNPAVGKDNWLVKFMMQTHNISMQQQLESLKFVNSTRDGYFERAFPELVELVNKANTK